MDSETLDDLLKKLDEPEKAEKAEVEELVEEKQPIEKVVLEPTIEEKARLQGWRPKSEYRGDSDLWVDAREFLHRGSYLKEINKLKKMVDQATNMAAKAREDAYKQAMNELEKERQNARILKDVQTLEHSYEKERQLKQQYDVPNNQQVAKIPINPLEIPAFVEFEKRSPWLRQDDTNSRILKAAFKEFGQEYEARNPNADPAEEIEYIESKLKEEFPQRFIHLNNNKPVEEKKVVSKVSAVNNTSPVTFYTASSGNNIDNIVKGLPPVIGQVVSHMAKRGQDYKSYLKEAKKQGLI